MFLACQIAIHSEKVLRRKISEKRYSFTVSASLQTSSVVYVARHGFACALFLLYFFIIQKQSITKFARVGLEIAMFKSKLQRISLSVYNQPKVRKILGKLKKFQTFISSGR